MGNESWNHSSLIKPSVVGELTALIFGGGFDLELLSPRRSWLLLSYCRCMILKKAKTKINLVNPLKTSPEASFVVCSWQVLMENNLLIELPSCHKYVLLPGLLDISFHKFFFCNHILVKSFYIGMNLYWNNRWFFDLYVQFKLQMTTSSNCSEFFFLF